MSRWARVAMVVLVIAGLTCAGLSIGRDGLHEMAAIAGRLGFGGLLAYCGYSLAVFVLLGGAWSVVAGEGVKRLPLFAWARLIREASADLLPFSQIGGIVVGIRTLMAGRVAAPVACASLIADLVTELASQLVFTVVGIACLGSLLTATPIGRTLLVPALVAAAALATIMVLLVSAPAGVALAASLVERVLPGGLARATQVGDALRTIYRRRARIAATFTINLTAWFASAAGAWLVLRLMQVPLSLGATLALESLVFLLRSVAFVVPGGLGVQEAAYLALGPMIGLPPEAALALALAKRARDVAISVPALLAWQVSEIGAVASWRTGRSR